MCKKLLTTILACAVINLVCSLPLLAQGQSEKELRTLEKIRASVTRLNGEPRKQVIVTLTDGTVVKGQINSAANDRFTVINKKSGIATSVSYEEVKNVRKKPSKGMVIGIVTLSVAAGAGILYLAGFALSKCGPCME